MPDYLIGDHVGLENRSEDEIRRVFTLVRALGALAALGLLGLLGGSKSFLPMAGGGLGRCAAAGGGPFVCRGRKRAEAGGWVAPGGWWAHVSVGKVGRTCACCVRARPGPYTYILYARCDTASLPLPLAPQVRSPRSRLASGFHHVHRYKNLGASRDEICRFVRRTRIVNVAAGTQVGAGGAPAARRAAGWRRAGLTVGFTPGRSCMESQRGRACSCCRSPPRGPLDPTRAGRCHPP